MRLSTKGHYAITAMMELASSQKSGPMRLADISEHQGISVSYLEQLFARLRKHGLVAGARGPGGGYRLAKETDQISVADILTAIDESSMIQSPDEIFHWNDNETATPQTMWRDLSFQLYDFLSQITLSEVIEQKSVQTAFAHYQMAGYQETRDIPMASNF